MNKYKYLGMVIHKNGKFKEAIADRVAKANSAIHMLKHVTGYSNSLSTKLSMSMFDKQISPILLYGSPIWGIPDHDRYINLRVGSIDTQVKKQSQTLINRYLNRHVQLDEVKGFRGKRLIRIKLHSLRDKTDLLYRLNSNNEFSFEDVNTNQKPQYEILHGKYCKYALNVPKHASTTGVYKEMNRYPLYIKVIVSALCFWHRLETGSNNVLLQNAYNECKANDHPYYQNILYLMTKNGLGNLALFPAGIGRTQFKFTTRQNLIDQYKQTTNSLIHTDTRFDTLRLVNIEGNHRIQTSIQNQYIRKCFTYLRLDKASPDG